MAVSIPPLNLNQASSADGRSQAAFDNSGFVVTLGGAKSASTSTVIVAALAIGAVLWLSRKA